MVVAIPHFTRPQPQNLRGGKEGNGWWKKGLPVAEDRGLAVGPSPLWGLKLRVLWLELEVGTGHLWIVQLFHL